MSKRKCPVCARTGRLAYEENFDTTKVNEFTFASRKAPELMHYEYHRCDYCTILFATHLPNLSQLIDAYVKAGFDSAEESGYAAATYLNVLKERLPKMPDSILDIGCSDGKFILACLDYGIPEVIGLEPSIAAINASPKHLSSLIINLNYEEYKPERQFDLVTLFQTIEHIQNPLDFLDNAYRLVKPGGYLAIACHDFRSPINRLMASKSPIFDLEHLQIFSKKGIAAAIAASNFELFSAKSYANTYPLSYWLKIAPIPHSIKSRFKHKRSRLGSLGIKLPVGNVMAIGRKPTATLS